MGAQICRDAVRLSRAASAWGAVVCSNAAPHHAMWADEDLQRECTAILLAAPAQAVH